MVYAQLSTKNKIYKISDNYEAMEDKLINVSFISPLFVNI